MHESELGEVFVCEDAPQERKLSAGSLGRLSSLSPHFTGSQTLQPHDSTVHFQEASLSGHGILEQNHVSEQTVLWMFLCPSLTLFPNPTYSARRDLM